MFHKFHVETKEAASRFIQPVRSGIIDWTTNCIGCLTCVKKICPQNAYEKRLVDPITLQDNLDSICHDCYRCVQSCPQRLIQKSINPEWESLGDDYWTPKIISTTWNQAETGKIPVSGAGYGGPFTGPGFDAMWTDMSEIVRPTRDGIHGREYISTIIQVGRRHLNLSFNDEGMLNTPQTAMREIDIPMLFELPDGPDFSPNVVNAAAKAVAELGSVLLTNTPECRDLIAADSNLADSIVPKLDRLPDVPPAMFWLTGKSVTPKNATMAAEKLTDSVVGYVIDFEADTPRKAVDMVEAGAGVLHLRADDHGRTPQGLFIKDAVRKVHLALVEQTLRDQVTILVSGGLSMAEHVAKVIICGADGVIIDWPMLLALECRYCPQCKPHTCPIDINEVDSQWGTQRIMNLIGAWRDQLIELMGAMGMREVRRLRGEVGRAMFFKDLEAEVFGPIFGDRG